MKVPLTHLPARIARLPQDERGYPVPWFVDWIDGKPIFPCIDPKKYTLAVREKRCWVCGDPLGSYLAFVAGPMCGINRTSAEPPSHRECAVFSVMNCPFLVNPNMKRIENKYTTGSVSPGGVMIKRNPGVMLVWVTKSYRVFPDGSGGRLISMGEPTEIELWAKGERCFDRGVFMKSVDEGIGELEKLARTDNSMDELLAFKAEFFELMDRLVFK